jgi:hypothetical protein
LTGLPTGRALWLALGDPFRLGWYGLGAAGVLALPLLFVLDPEIGAVVERYRVPVWFALILGYWIFAAPGALRLLGELREPAFNRFRLAMVAVTALMLFLIEVCLRYLFTTVTGGIDAAWTVIAFHLMVVVIYFVKETCMIRAARDREVVSPLDGILTIARRPGLVLVYATLYAASFLCDPVANPWFVDFIIDTEPFAAFTAVHVMIVAALVSAYLGLSMTLLVARAIFTRPDTNALAEAFD